MYWKENSYQVKSSAHKESSQRMERNDDEKQIINYLLSRLDEDEQRRVEERLLTDNGYFDLLLMAEDDLIDEYLRGDLSVDERERFEAHFLCSPERRKKLNFGMALKGYISAESAAHGRKAINTRPGYGWWKPLFSAPFMRLAAAAIIVVVLGVAGWRVFFYEPELNKGVTALNKAFLEQRPVESRISKLEYAPFSVTRGDEQGPIDRLSLNRAERILSDEADANPTAASLHALGRLFLAEKKFALAREQFEKALALDDKNAQLHSDYGALLMETGKIERMRENSGKSLETFANSLEHLNRALELDKTLLEALFNRALCHEYMLLYREAEKGWKDYIQKDPNSRWADEARQKLKEIEEHPPQSSRNVDQLFQGFLEAHKTRDNARAWKLISQNRDQTGSFIENRLINEYLDLIVKGRNDEAGERLEALSYAGEVEQLQARDVFIADLVRYYKSATSSQLDKVVQARGLMKSGHDGFAKYNYDAALESYREAKEVFERAGDACEAIYIDYLVGSCYLQQFKAESGLSFFQPLTLTCEKARYRWLLAQTLNAISTANQHLRDFSTAINNTNRSLKLSEEMGDTLGVVKARYQLGEIYRFVSNGRKALDLYVQDLPLTRAYFQPSAQLWRSYFSISRTFEQLDLYAAAIDFQKEALQLAVEVQAPRLICRSYNYLGLMFAKHGEYADAANSIERALEIGNSFQDKRVKIEATSYSFLQLGYVYRKKGDFDKAIENYDQAIRFYDGMDSKFFAFTARKEKLLCCMEQSGCPSVEQDMEAVLNLFEEHRAKIVEESNRNTFFDAEQSIYDVAIEFEHYKKGDCTKAFEYSERSRGRSLSDLASTSVRVIDNPDNPDMEFCQVSHPMSLEKIQAGMPSQSQILQYAVLKNSILIWVISKDGFLNASQTIPVADLNKRVGSFLQLISGKSETEFEAFAREATYLYDMLIRPVAGSLDSSKQLCIVPDKILNHVPFGALMSRDSGKYFIQEYEFVLSPSSNMFVRSSEAASEKMLTRSEKLLSVGNPSFDCKMFPDLGDLSRAAKEAKAIADYYDSPDPITEASATKKRVMSEMEKSDVIHLATHAVTDEWHPLRSKLLLAKGASGEAGEDSDGTLQAYEIYKLNLARVRLVVLSSCRSGIEKYYGGEGMIGLSRPFIAKRIPLVVASLWPVDSDPTARLMISFHRHRKKEPSPTAHALREAQLEMLRSPNSNDRLPCNWASFVTIGGYADF